MSSLTIPSFVPSLTAARHLAEHNSALALSLQRMSSGLSINTAGDDPAGLTISERLRSQWRGLEPKPSSRTGTVTGRVRSTTRSSQYQQPMRLWPRLRR